MESSLHTLPLTKETEFLAEKELMAGVMLKLTLVSKCVRVAFLSLSSGLELEANPL